MMTFPKNRLVFYSIFLGVLESLVGSLFFEGIVLLEQFLREGPFSIYQNQKFSPVNLGNIIILSIGPSILVSVILLAWWIQSLKKKSWSAKEFVIRGWFLGLCSGIGMCVYAYILFLHNSSLGRFLFLNITGLLAASLSGMLGGYLLSKLATVR